MEINILTFTKSPVLLIIPTLQSHKVATPKDNRNQGPHELNL